jgi:hypothetical protein
MFVAHQVVLPQAGTASLLLLQSGVQNRAAEVNVLWTPGAQLCDEQIGWRERDDLRVLRVRLHTV